MRSRHVVSVGHVRVVNTLGGGRVWRPDESSSVRETIKTPPAPLSHCSGRRPDLLPIELNYSQYELPVFNDGIIAPDPIVLRPQSAPTVAELVRGVGQ